MGIGISANMLKVIAIMAMFLDHIAVAFLEKDSFLGFTFHFIGRLTMPIICYFIAEGFYKTKSVKKYALRLLGLALISHCIFYYFATGIPLIQVGEHIIITFKFPTSVICTLFLGLVALIICKKTRLWIGFKVVMVLFLCFISMLADWGYVGVLWILIFGIFREDRRKKFVGFVVVGSIFVLLNLDNGLYQIGIFAAIPLLLNYNGVRGRMKKLKGVFYIFYPLHLLVLGILKWGL